MMIVMLVPNLALVGIEVGNTELDEQVISILGGGHLMVTGHHGHCWVCVLCADNKKRDDAREGWVADTKAQKTQNLSLSQQPT